MSHISHSLHYMINYIFSPTKSVILWIFQIPWYDFFKYSTLIYRNSISDDSSWRHKFCIIYLLCSKYMPSFKFVWNLQNVFFCRQSITKKTIFSICFCRLRATNSITVPPAGLFYMPRPLHSLLRTCVNFHGKCVSFFTKMSCFQSK